MPLRPFAAAARNLRRRPSFVVLVVLTLAIAIGVTTAMFSVVDTLLIRPLPFPVSDRLVEVWARAPGELKGSSRFSGAAIHDLRAQTSVFSAVEGYQFGTVTMTGAGDPIRVGSPQVTVGLMSMLGVAPRLGRLFTEKDEAAAVPVAILSEPFWRGPRRARGDLARDAGP